MKTGIWYYDIYNAIENAENAYEEAPEEKQLQEVPAKLNLEKEDGQGGTYIDENRFMGTAKTEDGKWYNYDGFWLFQHACEYKNLQAL